MFSLRNRSLALTTALFVSLFAWASAEQLWVRNRPFAGIVQGSGSEMLVELQIFVDTMGLTIEDKGDSVVVGGFPISVENIGAKRMVSLRDMVDAAGLHLTRNVQLGTVDVRGAEAGTGSSGSWDLDNSSQEKSRRSKTVLEGELFKAVIPSNLIVATAPEYLKEGDKDNLSALPPGNLNGPGQALKTIFLVTTKAGHNNGIAALNQVQELPSGATEEDGKGMIETLYQETRGAASKIIQQPRQVNLSGQRFYSMSYQDELGNDTVYRELYLQVVPKGNAVFFFTITVPQKMQNRTLPQLRLAVKGFRVKK